MSQPRIPAARVNVDIEPFGAPWRNLSLRSDEVDFFRKAMLAGVGTHIGFDWHEPDQIGLDVSVEGRAFDNAGTDGEKTVVLLHQKKGKISKSEVGRINLATLCALAMATVRRSGALG